MEQNSSFAQSANCLKQAVPFMVKYQIPLSPMNYAIWYCYVLGKEPELNKKLEQVLAEYGTCPPAQAKMLFDEFLSEQDLALFHEMSDLVKDTLNNVEAEINNTLSRSEDFSAVLSECHVGLHQLKKQNVEAGPEIYNDVLNYVSKLTQESIVMQHNALCFQKKLEVAYSEIKQLQETLTDAQAKASTDKLTDLYNRGKFDDDIVKFCNEPSSFQKVMIFIDIDHFKQFNDEFGHQRGDDVLRKVAQKLKLHTDKEGQAYRYGGEEFCILSSFSSISEAVGFSNKIREDIAKLSIKDKESGEVLKHITASFGIALYGKEMSWHSLVECADRALYLAKSHGRNRVEVAG
ncbi:diguanylate cyclase [Pseudoalteromonas luteoviolacea]|uniref:diguanylate cyclase n=1 Tax=Pseudoalteromonas luteoviolacea NCIMB 1942 TaxID=1365253 RepID=A0A166Y988_9GAMM|nr:diguanylate cyclase [Pseudoalteromonas luteoviolacea]KZN41581.1 hypothetical protein N482_20095 [Pseudoalteromonas luteoviolacea NCIMB 1942]KZW98456.1 diguanylate cyclase [Pseudoalteromonas luteoviolacea]